jgi:hypothetical protein
VTVTDHPGPGEAPFVSDDPDLLEPGPSFERHGEHIDPAQQGYAVVHNYAAYFWRPYLGNTAFALWELLLSFCYGERDIAFPSISRLARMLTNSDHSRAIVTGRRRPRARKATGLAAQRRTLGALEVLRRERLVQVRRRGRGPTARYTFRLLKALPLLRPDQVAQLSPRLQYDHANWLERYGIDDAAYREAYGEEGAPSTLAVADGAAAVTTLAAQDSTTAAPHTPAAARNQRAAAPDSTNNPHKDDPIEKWWQDTLDSLRLQMLRHTFYTYFGHTRPVAWHDGELTIRAWSPQQRELLEHRLAPVVLRELTEASAGQVRSVRFASPDGHEA